MTDDQILSRWLEQFATALTNQDIAAVTRLFHTDGYWRDILAFTWNIKTMEGTGAIALMLGATLTQTAPGNWAANGETEVQGDTLTVNITFTTATAQGTGRISLKDGLCHTLLTVLDDLHGHEEPRHKTRPKGIEHVANRNRKTWTATRANEVARLGELDQPYVLIVGGGQGGLALGARLRQLDVPTLIVDQNPRTGDSWRNRYRSLVLHDPVGYDHMPYLPFPQNWPVFTPKDKMGDWLECYAQIFELNIWQSTTCDNAHYDSAKNEWQVQITRQGKTITLHPKHLVFATGAYGPPLLPDWSGQQDFQGQLIHSSDYQNADAFLGKTCVVVGAGSSAHDIALDLWEAGTNVTMVQRSSTTVVRSDTLMKLGFEIYSEEAQARGIDVEQADLIAAATPFTLFCDGQKQLYQKIRTQDADYYARLTASGFALDFGEDDSGLMMKALRTASGYYIDVGASELIASGEIKVSSGAGVSSLTPTGLTLDNGQHIASDVIIACTGYQSMHETMATIVSREAADATGPCWGLGSGVRGDPGPWQGELRNMWKPTAVNALWYHGGNLALSRFYSRFLALQLKARMEGIDRPVYGTPAPHQSGL
ncbi:MAG: putative flavoprotein involved in K+ transport [Paracoccaceae bacterium]|jgi:putative flavoprotein involved in K+ transport